MSKKMDVDSEDGRTCNIITSDGESHRVARSMIIRWQTISELLELSDDASNDIPLPNVSSDIFKLLKIWDSEHSYVKKGEEIPIKINCGYKCFNLEEKPRAFFKKIHQENKHKIFELIKAANYLNIPDLYRAACRFVAMIIKEKRTSDKIREYLEFPTPSPRSGLVIVKYHNKWCEEL
ncbi:GSCOCG00007367001-RA-CDS [Cotesia congregata]|uniref:Similar to ASK9: SKP1-like protein 9 (Arabidopsis thaliana) n=1 Tax=Cotesia congregata TaxID=51543 RepID=A0A8J2EEE7_COTCN|nr:GSCOCG00007367001-RA-CDS [Cotesia congregata]CAG5076037.1 Similar to ASK9: SKP1-like protein 9 (Arabidopsis thaliana) [Cotesia congregata]